MSALSVTAVPVPGAALLFGTGLLGTAYMGRRKKEADFRVTRILQSLLQPVPVATAASPATDYLAGVFLFPSSTRVGAPSNS